MTVTDIILNIQIGGLLRRKKMLDDRSTRMRTYQIKDQLQNGYIAQTRTVKDHLPSS